PDQRAQLFSIRDQARADLENLRLESLKLRSVLIKDIVSSKYNPAEIELIKSKLRGVEDERISTLFRAIRKSNLTLGRFASAGARAEFDREMEDVMYQMDRTR